MEPEADSCVDARDMGTKEAAAYLGVSRSWLAHLRLAGQGPAATGGGRPGVAVRYAVADLDSWRRQFAERRATKAAQRYLPSEAS